jgi:hypothetical protein
MPEIAVSSPVDDAVVAALKTLIDPGRVGDGTAPLLPKPTPSSAYPYIIARSSIVRSEGSLPAPKESALHRVELTVVGLDRAGVSWLADEARTLLIDVTTLDIDGGAVVWTEDAGGQPLRVDFDVTPNVFFAVVVVNVFVTTTPTGS